MDNGDMAIGTCSPNEGIQGIERHAVEIEHVENGFYARVGCKRFVFASLEALVEALKLYYTDPQAAAEKYCRPGAGFRGMLRRDQH